jgi:hypothetical protein
MAQVRHQKDEMVVWTDWDPGIKQGATVQAKLTLVANACLNSAP